MSEVMEKNIVHFDDDHGHTIELQEYEGSYYPAPFPFEAVKNYRFMDIRPDDVILCNYPKSGTHWFWEILSQLVAGKAENMRETWKGDRMIEFIPPDVLASSPSPRVLNAHVLFEQVPLGIIEKKCKIVYLLRNPKDVAVSFYHHHKGLKGEYKYDGGWKGHLYLYNNGLVDWGSWFDNTISYFKAMRQHPELPILVVYYEDMIQDPVAEVRQLAQFLGVEADDQLCRDIVAKCSLDTMKAVAKETRKGLVLDGVTLAFRKGGVGGWKNWYTVAQSEEFDTLYAEKMAGYDIPLKYSL